MGAWGADVGQTDVKLVVNRQGTSGESVVEFILYLDRLRRRLSSRAPLSRRRRLRITCTSVVALCHPTEADS